MKLVWHFAALLLACVGAAAAQEAATRTPAKPAPPSSAAAPRAAPSMLIVGCDPGGCWDEYGMRYDAAGAGLFIRRDGANCQSVKGRMVCKQ